MKPLHILAVATIVIASSGPVAAQDKPENPIQELQFLIGAWRGEYVASTDVPEVDLRKGQRIVQTAKYRWTAGNSTILMQFHSLRDGKPGPGAQEIVTWDPAKEELVHIVYGDGYHGTGEWSKKENAWILDWEITSDQERTYKGKSIIRPVNDNEHTWQIVDQTVNGKAVPDMEPVHFRRIDEAARLAAYFRTSEGTWEITDSEGTQGTLEVRMGVTKRALLISGEVGDVRWDEIFGYDPRTGKWTCSGIGESGERYFYALHGVPNRDHQKPGDRWRAQSRGVMPDGRATSGTIEFVVEGPDKFKVMITNSMIGDERQEDVTMTYIRK